MASPHRDRTVALSLQLAQAHQELRRRIGRLKRNLGTGRLPDDVLATHCLAFCATLTAHHEGEDGGLFTQLLADRPDLAGTVSKLVADHTMMASILSRTAELARAATGAQGSALDAVDRELDGLMAIMESHFSYEERALRAALDDGVTDTGWTDQVLGFAPPS